MDQPITTGPSRPLGRAKFRIGGAVVALAVIGLVSWALARPGSTAFYLTTSEMVAKGPTTISEGYRVNGNVVAGSIDQDGLETTFTVTDGKTEMPVLTDRPLPDTFKDGSEVVVKGSFDGEQFVATEVLAKCPSKFKAKS
jgi:cytochrome c-type biogenesis protein CcmE